MQAKDPGLLRPGSESDRTSRRSRDIVRAGTRDNSRSDSRRNKRMRVDPSSQSGCEARPNRRGGGHGARVLVPVSMVSVSMVSVSVMAVSVVTAVPSASFRCSGEGDGSQQCDCGHARVPESGHA